MPQTPIDAKFFESHRCRPEFGDVDGFAPDADALVSQILQRMASEPVCTVVVTPPLQDPDRRKVLSLSSHGKEPLAVRDVVVMPKTIEGDNGALIAYEVTTVFV